MHTSLGPSLPSGRVYLAGESQIHNGYLRNLPVVLPSTAHPVSRTATHVRDRSCILADTSEGVVLVDCGAALVGDSIVEAVRQFSPRPIHTCIYT
jgi:hypothetical protein